HVPSQDRMVPITPGSTRATTVALLSGLPSSLMVPLLSRCQGATIAVRFPDRSDWLIHPSDPSPSRTLRQVSYSWPISMGRPALANTVPSDWVRLCPVGEFTRLDCGLANRGSGSPLGPRVTVWAAL